MTGSWLSGVRPFVELSFMPTALAASQKPHPFWYKPLPNPPRSYEKWGTLIENFTRHLEDRYGADEVRQWYFEVWNEPNIDFWTGKPAKSTYYELYDAAAKAVKIVDRRLRVGGPATAQAAWVGDFIRHCDREGYPGRFRDHACLWKRHGEERPEQGRGHLARGDGGARGAEGLRRGQSIAAAGSADHLVRV